MSFKVIATNDFQKTSKKLLKKHKSLKQELLSLIYQLENNPTIGTPLGNECFKIRLALKSTGKGKSGGARVITYVKVINECVYLLVIYSKSERDSITNKEISELTKKLE